MNRHLCLSRHYPSISVHRVLTTDHKITDSADKLDRVRKASSERDPLLIYLESVIHREGNVALDLSNNLSNSFEYAKKLFSDFGRLVILIILDLIPLVNWIVVGYAARVLRESPGAEAPPKLEKYGELFVDGAKIFVASIIYMLIPLILIGAGVGSFITAAVLEGGPDFMLRQFAPSQALLFGGTGLVLVLVGVVVAFVMLIVLAGGIAHMLKTGHFSKAFAFGEILGKIGKIGWGKYLAWIVLVAIIAAIVGGITGAIPYVGWIISAIIGPALIVFIFRSLGLLYSE